MLKAAAVSAPSSDKSNQLDLPACDARQVFGSTCSVARVALREGGCARGHDELQKGWRRSHPDLLWDRGCAVDGWGLLGEVSGIEALSCRFHNRNVTILHHRKSPAQNYHTLLRHMN